MCTATSIHYPTLVRELAEKLQEEPRRIKDWFGRKRLALKRKLEAEAEAKALVRAEGASASINGMGHMATPSSEQNPDWLPVNSGGKDLFAHRRPPAEPYGAEWPSMPNRPSQLDAQVESSSTESESSLRCDEYVENGTAQHTADSDSPPHGNTSQPADLLLQSRQHASQALAILSSLSEIATSRPQLTEMPHKLHPPSRVRDFLDEAVPHRHVSERNDPPADAQARAAPRASLEPAITPKPTALSALESPSCVPHANGDRAAVTGRLFPLLSPGAGSLAGPAHTGSPSVFVGPGAPGGLVHAPVRKQPPHKMGEKSLILLKEFWATQMRQAGGESIPPFPVELVNDLIKRTAEPPDKVKQWVNSRRYSRNAELKRQKEEEGKGAAPKPWAGSMHGSMAESMHGSASPSPLMSSLPAMMITPERPKLTQSSAGVVPTAAGRHSSQQGADLLHRSVQVPCARARALTRMHGHAHTNASSARPAARLELGSRAPSYCVPCVRSRVGTTLSLPGDHGSHLLACRRPRRRA